MKIGSIVQGGVQGIADPAVLGAVAGAYGNNLARSTVLDLVGQPTGIARTGVDAAMLILGAGLALRGTGIARGLGYGIAGASGVNLVNGFIGPAAATA